MNKYGFIIEKLELLGDSVETVSIEFKKGLNVIYGPSDTGKTFIFQCISYMLGASKKPKKIPEASNFKKARIYIKTYLNKSYRLERALNGGDFELLENETNNKIILKSKNDKQSPDETISKFLLKLSNINEKEVLKNKEGKKQIIYFQDLLKYFLIDEEKIITERSIIADKPERGFNGLKTFEENVFKFLLTGQDDSDIIVALKPKDVQNKTGKLEVYNELISQIDAQLKDIDYKKVDEQIEKLNMTISNFKKEEIYLSEELNQLNSEKNNLTKKIDEDKKSWINFDEILKRSSILKKQYASDIARLKANIELGTIFPEKKTSCPVCDSSISENIDIEKLILATESEITKTSKLLIEVEKSESIFIKDKSSIESKIKDTEFKLKAIILTMEEKVNNEIKDILSKIELYTDKREELSKIKLLKNNLDSYVFERDKIQLVIDTNKKTKKETNYEKLTITLLDPIITNIKTILTSINFENIESANIGFSEENLDIFIGQKNRKDYGKGYKAILYAVFIISILEFLRTKDYQIGLTVIDSPLNPYKPDDKDDNGQVSINLAEEFYRYLADNIIEEQVILIENTQIPNDIRDKVNYKIFTKENGFLPKVSINDD
ncbi:AAA family ATPase [Sulfurimonas sp. NWX367]|uniref:AAA family ATPase n=1 Tax=Sulfurimonas sp. NWX367 TaxID=2925413 RepID=UPI003204D2F0